MDDLISRQAAIDAVRTYYDEQYTREDSIEELLEKLPSTDVVEVVRCKDCKHRPTGTNRDDLVFPDEKCPCQCEDFWYSWKPSDDWFCGNGERKAERETDE